MHWIARANQLANAARTAQTRATDVPERGVFAKQTADRGQLYIYDFIGESFMWGSGVTAKSVADELGKLKGVSTLDVFINSEGGSVVEGKGIYNSLKRFAAKKVVHVDGIAASAASFIAMVGDQIIMAENATMMIHEAFGIYGGTASDFFSAIQDLDRENKLIAEMYAARTGKPAAEFWARAPMPNGAATLPPSTGLMAVETEFTAPQAVKMKLADEIDANVRAVNVGADEALEAKIPALRIAVDTQRRLAASRAHRESVLVDQAQSILLDRRRASPGHTTPRPAART